MFTLLFEEAVEEECEVADVVELGLMPGQKVVDAQKAQEAKFKDVIGENESEKAISFKF